MEQKFSLSFYQAATLGSSYHFQGVSIFADSSLTYPAGGAPSAALSTQAKTSNYSCWSRIFQTSQKKAVLGTEVALWKAQSLIHHSSQLNPGREMDGYDHPSSGLVS